MDSIMAIAINPNTVQLVPSLATIGSAQKVETATTGLSVPFSDFLSEALAATVQTDAVTKGTDLGMAIGDTEDIHNITIAGSQADIMLNLVVQVRNRMVEGYQEIMRMQI
jgi:flagellar hook-basal body complex protein FliE